MSNWDDHADCDSRLMKTVSHSGARIVCHECGNVTDLFPN